MLRPFEQPPFSALPERPRVPHGYASWAVSDLVLDSRPFGRHRVRVRTLGDGPPLLLVHGLMTSGYSFRYVADALATTFRVVVPDLVGSGESDMPDVSYRPAAYATWLAELVRALGIEGCDVVGNSMGGYLAMRLALEHPELLRRLVVVHSPAIPLPRLRALRAALSLPVAPRLLDAVVRLDPERWVHANVHYYDESLKSLEECRIYAAPLRTRAGRRAFGRILHETLEPTALAGFGAELEALRRMGEPFPVPMLLLYAEQDVMVPPEVGDALHRLVPSARYVKVPNASHFMHVDAPEAFLRETRAFLLPAAPPDLPRL